jgi:hypothetical protein
LGKNCLAGKASRSFVAELVLSRLLSEASFEDGVELSPVVGVDAVDPNLLTFMTHDRSRPTEGDLDAKLGEQLMHDLDIAHVEGTVKVFTETGLRLDAEVEGALDGCGDRSGGGGVQGEPMTTPGSTTTSNATRSRLSKVSAKRLKQWGLILLLHPLLKLFLRRESNSYASEVWQKLTLSMLLSFPDAHH